LGQPMRNAFAPFRNSRPARPARHAHPCNRTANGRSRLPSERADRARNSLNYLDPDSLDYRDRSHRLDIKYSAFGAEETKRLKRN
jgi:hypothetical protein